ncbi:acetyl-CoA carboxylase biotin carboxyl carrier protein [Staphylococcus auricularis]|uniref:Acetyl-CoA carboxylase biotin carboxyl carrier protein subunit n=1 Tax=Staphylococcus auricularis TaxID=29379 RepID=A0AAP8PMI1_9STAP|nr:biotin/lipoyl-containing protein [Staphylococcus auricularis]MBM0868019.1 acetyl-CoA carboxylase biotin carboxyl carrier protein subunit [Staphylococcus auricularis]MCG7340982.1 acetyl-CoA carboxylase biotin carboxyl carrier protein subunit [Staphylococcus auricularis]MDC6326837.1 acetyl-CoA carboxylase biotin carboxyl carrier protein subunit [Staphylococcus auricularis]MDN4532714.1 biotin/lipoyl-containing protein [Staphylococcus auricularis]PNZ66088.1 acetyl-CoA carboxylase biotin carboxy
MNFEQVEKIIKLVKDNEVQKFKYKDYEHEIELDFTQDQQQAPQQVEQTSVVSGSENSAHTSSGDQASAASDDLKAIKTQMVGTFYLQDEKELTEPVVKVGDQINEGDIVGYIEAMKVMNEVTSDVSGTVEEILVDHGSNVEYDQTIIKVK